MAVLSPRLCLQTPETPEAVRPLALLRPKTRGAGRLRGRPSHNPNDVRKRNSPRIFRAKCSSNAVSFLAFGSGDREFIVDIGEDRDVGVDPSGQAAAKL